MRKIHFAIVVDIWVGFQFLKICPRVHIPKFDFWGGFSFSGLNPGLSSRVSAIPARLTVPKKNSQKANSLYSALKKRKFKKLNAGSNGLHKVRIGTGYYAPGQRLRSLDANSLKLYYCYGGELVKYSIR